MSRSKKAPWYVQGGKKYGKRFANKRLRRYKLHLLQNMSYKKLYESWDICDWKFYAPDDKKAYRK